MIHCSTMPARADIQAGTFFNMVVRITVLVMLHQWVKQRLAAATMWLMVMAFALPAIPAFACKCSQGEVSCCCCDPQGASCEPSSCCGVSINAAAVHDCSSCKCRLFCPCRLAKGRLPHTPAPSQEETPDKANAESFFLAVPVLDSLPSFPKRASSHAQRIAFCSSSTQRCIILSRFTL